MKTLKIAAIATAIAATFTLGTLAAPPQAQAGDSSVRFAFAGDSLTAGGSSWLKASWDNATLVNAGGYAKSGNTAAQTLAAIKPVAADVLVIMLGTNDVRLGVPTSTTLANFDKIVRKVGAPRVVLVATPPSDLTRSSCPKSCRTGQFVLNRAMAQHAAKRGWLSVDPWSNHRLMNQGWTDGGDNGDGRHPSPATSQFVEDRMERYIRQAFEGTI